MYVDYNYYKNVYSGKVAEEVFNNLQIRAKALVDYYTFNRVDDLPVINDDVKLAVCELVDLLLEQDKAGDKLIESESVGSYSVKYKADSLVSNTSKQRQVIYKYLAHSNMLYRGTVRRRGLL